MSLIPSAMPSLVWEGPRRMVLRETPLPALLPDEVLIRVAYAGICGSELSGYLGHNALRVPPLVMGHEFSGEVAALGDGALELSPALAPGMAVTANPMVYCGNCEACRQGLNHLCASRRLVGAHRPGAFAGYTTVPAWMVLPLPEKVGLREGALSEPVACAVRAAGWAGELRGETFLVVGAGAIGLLTLQVLLLRGAARVFIADTDEQRLAAGRDLGGEALDPRAVNVVKTVREETGGRGAAAAVDAVGKAVTREQCIAAVRSAGTVVLTGLHEEASVLPVADVIRREITLRGSFAYTPADFEEAVSLLAREAVRLAPWIVEAPLAEGADWFERLCAENPGGSAASLGAVAKVLLKPREG
jgi:threonine dehydrogenase-like Zn-dependent dehydrogenase